MSAQPNIQLSVLIALLIHVAIAGAVYWQKDTAALEYAAVSQGLAISLDNQAYQHIMQRQKTEAVMREKALKVDEEKKTMVKKTSNKKRIKSIQQSVSVKTKHKKAVTYQVAEKVKETVKPVTEIKSVEQAPVKVASAKNTPLQTTGAQQKNEADGGEQQKPLDLRDTATKRYISALMRHLNRYKQYPVSLKKNHIEGKPVIRFSINKSGHVTNIEVKKCSQSAELDQTAMDVFRRASPLPKIPSELARETLTMSLPIAYSLIND